MTLTFGFFLKKKHKSMSHRIPDITRKANGYLSLRRINYFFFVALVYGTCDVNTFLYFLQHIMNVSQTAGTE